MATNVLIALKNLLEYKENELLEIYKGKINNKLSYEKSWVCPHSCWFSFNDFYHCYFLFKRKSGQNR